MLNPLKEKKGDGIIIFDNKKDVVFSTVDSDLIQLIKKYDLETLANYRNKDLNIKDKLISVERIRRGNGTDYIIILRSREYNAHNPLLKYKNLNTGFYDRKLLENLKDNIIDLSYLNSYSIILVNFKSSKRDGDLFKNFESTIVNIIREVDIPIRYDDNTILIITPVTKMENLNSFIKRINSATTHEFALMNISIDVSMGIATSKGDMNFLNVLYNAEKNVYKEKKNKKFSKFEEEADISKRIENVRQELCSMINQFDAIGLDCEVVEMSQYLDRLLIEYITNSGRENYGEK
jgi:GGDEF domain-containing protein